VYSVILKDVSKKFIFGFPLFPVSKLQDPANLPLFGRIICFHYVQQLGSSPVGRPSSVPLVYIHQGPLARHYMWTFPLLLALGENTIGKSILQQNPGD
jgi:hypothetical protein